MKYLYRIYQIVIALPIIVLATIIVSLTVVIGTTLGNKHFWSYYPGKVWGMVILRSLLLPVRIEGRENLQKGQSYVFVSNHQGGLDIPLIYGFLGRNFKWMMKHQLRKVPFLGIACQYCRHIFVDRSSPSKVKQTYETAKATLQNGMSLVVFPEGSRSFTGHMGKFKRGAFMLANEIQLPVVPLTINGSFDIMPRTTGYKKISWHPIRLKIHSPIMPIGQDADNIKYLMDKSYETIMNGLDAQYQGYKENPDQ